ncbi:hypothetical protein [Nocardia brasiliensis]|uniref:hypothetical protein n=1 Tax=Nocardia brasiliensis TaxID=37326 RepID=UPI0024561921|nr:hypothetical protein [Nocardia brasiliensis]
MARLRNERDRGMHELFVARLGEFLDTSAGRAEIVHRRSNEIAPSVRQLLAEYHEDTVERLWVAPVDSRTRTFLPDGSDGELDEDGWVDDPAPEPDGLVVDAEPISIRDMPES